MVDYAHILYYTWNILFIFCNIFALYTEIAPIAYLQNEQSQALPVPSCYGDNCMDNLVATQHTEKKIFTNHWRNPTISEEHLPLY